VNPIIIERFDLVEQRLIQSPVVIAYEIIRREVAPSDGKLRVKVAFIDESVAELFEYVTALEADLKLSKYSFHWQDRQGDLKCRWDNSPHHPELPNAPHHRHYADQSVSGVSRVPDIFTVLEEIEEDLRKTLDVSIGGAA
jgi:hypothetical protein